MKHPSADDSYEMSSFFFFQENKFYISCESSAGQMIHMKCQALFYWKIIRKKQFRMLSAINLSNTLRINSTIQKAKICRLKMGLDISDIQMCVVFILDPINICFSTGLCIGLLFTCVCDIF